MKIRDVEYFVRTIGNGPKHLLFLHGFTGQHSNWSKIIDHFNDKSKFTFILVDLLGHGKSESPLPHHRYSMEHTLEDLKEIIESLGYNKVTVVGYSMGGRIALSFANRYPHLVNKLVLESASPGLRTEIERKDRVVQDELLALKIENNGLDSFVDFWMNIPLFASQKQFLDDEKWEAIRKQKLQNNEKGLANSLRGIGTGCQPPLWDHLPLLSLPVLILTGELDQKFVKIGKEMNDLLPNATFYKFLEAGHAIHVEQAEKFGKIVSEFCRN
ncbi:2-succinyl-6-hydroxy-2,4-cyclohexadiene-1-carboxylate synthase [Sutcliffiella cohnii]|uniref:2-succinyl-6-hydroxy-2, 4-cyclohexadiene-1-carboxylate synthase n=1 Tax=Sutcliffiella cohnii TaxID=33932 RepID=UPI002E211FB8|nr:2-succinyl-6-hydroxy-2,4-cyclohexadiene-1-carboxylate synthase [Sutcliffiella cohnii]MED4016060.1 2-succinyl-6-hydroxy-2,4-cyclohexadiene-1-carboxylate synthase [Sutcliffiella cohnii]